MVRNAVAATILVFCSIASYAEGMAVSAHISPEGEGVDLTRRMSDSYNLRIAYRQYSYQGTDPLATFRQAAGFITDWIGITKSDNAYDHNGRQKLLSVMADWYPDEESQSRLTFGLGYNNSKDDITGKELPLGGYNLGANHYSAAQVGRLQGTLEYNKFAPYLGFGWGNPVKRGKNWGLVADIGMLYEGSPKARLSTTGTGVLQSDIAAEQTRLEKDTWTWSPMMSVGISYQW
jgi:hypothetical protein